MFVGFSVLIEIFHSSWDITITCEVLEISTYTRNSWTSGVFNVPYLFWQGTSPSTRETPFYCRAFSSGAVIICYYDERVMKKGFGHQSSTCEVNALTNCASSAALLYVKSYKFKNAIIVRKRCSSEGYGLKSFFFVTHQCFEEGYDKVWLKPYSFQL